MILRAMRPMPVHGVCKRLLLQPLAYTTLHPVSVVEAEVWEVGRRWWSWTWSSRVQLWFFEKDIIDIPET